MNFSVQKDKSYFGYFASRAGKLKKTSNKKLACLPWCFNVDPWHQVETFSKQSQ